MIRFIKNYITRIKVEKALGIRLYDWQKEYIFDKDCEYLGMIGFALGVRGNGKTLAHQLKLLLDYKAEPLNIKDHYHSQPMNYVGTTDYRICETSAGPFKYAKWYYNQLIQLYETLKAHNIKVREIIY